MKDRKIIFLLVFILLLVVTTGILVAQNQQSIYVTADGVVMLNINGELQDLRQFLVPIGTIQAFIGEERDVPDGWALCDGREVSKADYPVLYAMIGNKFGETADNFELPDLRGRFIRGVDSSSMGISGTDKDAQSRVDKNENTVGDIVGSFQSDRANSLFQVQSVDTNSSTTTITIPDDGSWSSHMRNDRADEDSLRFRKAGGETRPVNMSVNYIIKL